MNDDITDVVDEIADEIDPARIEREAIRLGIDPHELIDRVATELKARVEV